MQTFLLNKFYSEDSFYFCGVIIVLHTNISPVTFFVLSQEVCATNNIIIWCKSRVILLINNRKQDVIP
jgi:hypothetical protein